MTDDTRRRVPRCVTHEDCYSLSAACDHIRALCAELERAERALGAETKRANEAEAAETKAAEVNARALDAIGRERDTAREELLRLRTAATHLADEVAAIARVAAPGHAFPYERATRALVLYDAMRGGFAEDDDGG